MTAQRKRIARSFTTGDTVLYPAHGVGTLISIEEQEVAGLKLEVFVINFERDKMTLRVPTNKAVENGLVVLSDIVNEQTLGRILKIVSGGRKIKRAMWSRRAQEFEQKTHSGDLIALSEVVRDLNRSRDEETTNSYSEQQILEAATRRLIDILAFGWETGFADATKRLNQHLLKHRKRELRV